MNEQELINKAKFDKSVLETALIHYKPLVVTVAKKYFMVGGDNEDLVQEGMIGLLGAINSYDSSKNNNFTIYAKTLIERKIINAIKIANSKKHSFLNEGLPLDNQGDVISEDDQGFKIPAKYNKNSPDKKIINLEDIKSLLKDMTKNLSDFEKKVLNLYIFGYSYKEIAKEFDKSPKSIDNAINRIKNKLQFLKKEK